MTFWEWLREFANARVRAAYFKRVKHECQCWVCRTWNSEVGGCREVIEDGPWFEITRCNRCGNRTRWDMRSAIPYLADTQLQLENLHPNT